MIFFFFSSRRRHTRSLCDWSSDVCSSDLADLVRGRTGLVNQLRDDVRRVLRDNRASVEGGIQVTQRGVQLRISDPNERARIAPKLRALSQPISNVILGQTGARNVDIA